MYWTLKIRLIHHHHHHRLILVTFFINVVRGTSEDEGDGMNRILCHVLSLVLNQEEMGRGARLPNKLIQPCGDQWRCIRLSLFSGGAPLGQRVCIPGSHRASLT